MEGLRCELFTCKVTAFEDHGKDHAFRLAALSLPRRSPEEASLASNYDDMVVVSGVNEKEDIFAGRTEWSLWGGSCQIREGYDETNS